MKKLLTIMCAVFLVVGLSAGQAFAIGYEADANPTTDPGTDYDTSITIDVGASLTFDVNLTEVPQSLITAGVTLSFDPSAIAITGALIYDGADISRGDGGTNWDSGFSGKVGPINVGPGQSIYNITCGNFAGVAPVPGAPGMIPIVRVTVQSISDVVSPVGFQPIPGSDTVVGDSTVFDGDITPTELVIEGFIPPCSCDLTGPANPLTADAFAPVVVDPPYEATGNAFCDNPPAYSYSDTCVGADVDAVTGVLTIAAAAVGESCEVCATDSANTDDMGAPIECCTPVEIEQGGTCDVEIALGQECPGEEIDDPAYNRPGRRGLAATCGDIIDFTVCSDCDPYDPACIEWSVDPADGDFVITQLTDCCWRLTVGDICDELDKIKEYEITVEDTCNFGSDTIIIQVGKVILDVQDATVDPESGSVASRSRSDQPGPPCARRTGRYRRVHRR